MQQKTTSAEQTNTIAKEFAKSLHGGDIVLLHGDLGAGKTTFTKGIAEALGVEDTITSPTFTLMNVYPIKNSKFEIQNLIHIDTYRLEDAAELVDIGVEDYLGDPNTVCLIEWPEKIKNLLQGKKVVDIFFEHAGEDENTRKITIRHPERNE
jgi:tRNA threonylcarbamoyladenosine biosynthesis protein TsaE